MKWLAVFLTLLSLAAGAEAPASPSPPEDRPTKPYQSVVQSSGEDPARPLERFDVRLNAQEKANHLWESQLTFRVDTIHYESDDWTLYTRFDFPVGRTAQPDNPTLAGLSDTLMQLFAATPGERVEGLLGLRITVPTATRTNLGKGKWTLAPELGLVVQVPEISAGTFMGVAAWNTSDFAGNGHRDHLNQLTLKPLVHFELGDGWFVQTEPEIIHDNLNRTWFIPVDLMVGKLVSKNVVISLEFEHSVSGYQPNFFQYYQLYEFRTGVFF